MWIKKSVLLSHIWILRQVQWIELNLWNWWRTLKAEFKRAERHNNVPNFRCDLSSYSCFPNASDTADVKFLWSQVQIIYELVQ